MSYYRRLARLMSTNAREGDGARRIGNAEEIMKQKIEPGTTSSGSKAQPLLGKTEASKRLLKKVQKLMHDAIHVKNPLVPDKTLTQLREEYRQLDWEGRWRAINLLSTEFGVDKQRVKDLVQQYSSLSSDTRDPGILAAQFRTERELRTALVPLSTKLFEHMNTQAEGLKFLVDFRSDLLSVLREENAPALRALDSDMQSLFSSWLSPACLQLHQVTWDDSAALLEKIVRYEAVHPINDLYDLKRRLGTGRRCFGYFHPAMPGEPLVFIEVALTESMSNSIQELLFDKSPLPEDEATTAMFYSISSTQPGLAGIDLGNFLIKRVLRLVQQEMSNIKTFATLSPIPGFRNWLLPKLASRCTFAKREDNSAFKEEILTTDENEAIMEAYEGKGDGHEILCNLLSSPDYHWTTSQKLVAGLKTPLMRLCARYLLQEKKRGKALDPVANFHLRNGASVDRLNWMADTSAKGLQESCGMMANYLYRCEKIEENNQAYINKGTIDISGHMQHDLPSSL